MRSKFVGFLDRVKLAENGRRLLYSEQEKI